MRDIKFRIWSVEYNEMVYPKNYVIDFNWFGVTNEHYLDDSAASEFPIHEKEYILMQYTGLKDSNGVEIFEGDILKYINTYSGKEYTKEVRYDNDLACFGLFDKKSIWCQECDWMALTNLEVIGNIHENPELIK